MFKNGKYKHAKVYIRILPAEKKCDESIKVLDDKRTIYAGYEKKARYWNFSTDGVFYNTSQEEVYKTVINDDFLNE